MNTKLKRPNNLIHQDAPQTLNDVFEEKQKTLIKPTTPKKRRKVISKMKPTRKIENSVCYNDYDFGFLNHWRKQKITMCKGPNAQLNCFITRNAQIPKAPQPITACEARNIVIDFSKIISAACLKHRPGYMCGKPWVYPNFVKGALQQKCKREKEFTLSQFSRDFGRDIFDSFEALENEEIQYDDVVKETTIFVTRERGEHCNMFHANTDWFQTFQMLQLFNLDPKQVRIVIMDTNPSCKMDIIWNSAYSKAKPFVRVADFNKRKILFERAIFQPAGYANIMLSHLTDHRENPGKCHNRIHLIEEYSKHIMSSLEISPKEPKSAEDPVRIIFVSRRPHNVDVEHSFMARQIDNEDEVEAMLQSIPNVEVQKIDFVKFTLKEQIEMVHRECDILIGMHGAALTHSLWLAPQKSGVLEIWPRPEKSNWRCFEQFTKWKGNVYDIYYNEDMSLHRRDSAGDYLTINVEKLKKMVVQMVSKIRSMR